MGRDKRAIRLPSGLELLHHTFSVLEPMFERVSLVGEIPATCQHLDADILPDAAGIEGPIAGLIAGLRAYPSSPLFVVAVDMPDLSTELIEILLQTSNLGLVERVVPEGEKGVEPLCGIYFCTALQILEQAANRGRFGLQKLPLRERIVSRQILREKGCLSDWGLRSLNTPEDVEEYERGTLGDVLASKDTPM